jgi:hypothetical protein
MKKVNMLAIVFVVSAMVAMPASAKMSKRTKGFLVGALAGSAITYMVNRNNNNNENENERNCHIEEVLKKNEYGEYEKVNLKVCNQ